MLKLTSMRKSKLAARELASALLIPQALAKPLLVKQAGSTVQCTSVVVSFCVETDVVATA